ncbi:MAG: M23 family metallopeptidase [Nitrospinae bacterium]|nr:M23 family metallopeptidase [Nitrospinota bacterium]
MTKRLITLALVISGLFMASCAERADISKNVYNRGDSETGGLFTSNRTAKYHVVKRGDTLYSIAKRYGISVQTLKGQNGISDARSLDVGARLVITPGNKRAVENRPTLAMKDEGVEEVYYPVMEGKFIWPLRSVSIGSHFGIRHESKHDGIDLRAPKGEPIMAIADGKVIYAGWGPAGYGKIVILKHDRRTISVYAHNDENMVAEGQEVKQGETVAGVGRTGRATGYHCHFELRIDRKPVDPARYMPTLTSKNPQIATIATER